MKECCRGYLEEQFGGDKAAVDEIYAEYVSAARAKLAEARSALGAGDFAAFDRAAHALKGAAYGAGDEETALLAIESRKAAAAGDAASASSLLARMDAACAAL